jgi:hypothetical protein
MHNIIELANNVRNLMEQITDIGASRERLQALRTRAKQIQKVREIIDDANTARSLLEAAEVEVSARPQATKKLIAKCHHVIEGFENNWEKTAKDKALSQTFIEPTKEYAVAKMGLGLKQDWQSFVDELSPPIKRAWIDGLPDAGPLGEAKANVSDHLAKLNELRTDMPKSVEDVARVREISGAASRIFDELDDIPEAVRNFLMSASRAGAKVDDFTDDVRAWMTEHDMINRLRIRLG